MLEKAGADIACWKFGFGAQDGSRDDVAQRRWRPRREPLAFKGPEPKSPNVRSRLRLLPETCKLKQPNAARGLRSPRKKQPLYLLRRQIPSRRHHRQQLPIPPRYSKPSTAPDFNLCAPFLLDYRFWVHPGIYFRLK